MNGANVPRYASGLEGNGLADVRYYVDKESGDTLDRPAFRRLQADVFKGTIKTWWYGS